MRKRIFAVHVFLFWLCCGAAAASSYNATDANAPIVVGQSAVIVQGAALPRLLGVPRNRISAHVQRQNTLHAVPVQIDGRDKEGYFELQASAADRALDGNDDCVIGEVEGGVRLSDPAAVLGDERFAELRVYDHKSGREGWLYLVARPAPADAPNNPRLRYDAQADRIESDRYRLGFSRDLPFLVEEMRWHDSNQAAWSDNLTDGMSVRHVGKLFGRVDFERTTDDYKSELEQIKQGPVRIIRRTANKVRILGWLSTPSVIIDYVAYADGFEMNTMVDLPFRIGAFFDDVETYMLMSWRSSPANPRIATRSVPEGAALDGVDSAAERAINAAGDVMLELRNDVGAMQVLMEKEDRLPVAYAVYVRDADATGPAQIGFHTSNWEAVDTDVYRLTFHVTFPRVAHSYPMAAGVR